MEMIEGEAHALETRRREIEDQLRRLAEEEESVKGELAALRGGNGDETWEWATIPCAPESPVGTLSVESFESEAARDVTVCEDAAAPRAASEVTGVNWSAFDADDLFSDPRCIAAPVAASIEDDVTAPPRPELPVCPPSDVHDEVMELLRRSRAQQEREDRTRAEQYLRCKPDPPRHPATWTQYRFPLSEYEEWKRILGLWGEELLSGMQQQIPDQIDPTFQRPFIDRNRLVRNPEIEMRPSFEKRPWAAEEIRIFLERFMEYPKASHICHIIQ